MLTTLRDGAWITRERILAFCRLMLAMGIILLGALFLTSNGKVDRFDRPIGTDFSQIWVGGLWTLDGVPEKAFDNEAHYRRQQQEFTPTSGFFAWGYPPMLLAVAAFFALFPYWLALLVWQASTFPLYLGAIRRILPGPTPMLAACAFPAVFVNVAHGHNGFLTAGLFGFGVALIGRRPWLAGVCLGLLAYKPQFGLLIPLALVAGGHWRAIAGAGLTVAATALATVAAWGLAPWRGFVWMMDWSRVELLEQGATGFQKIQSVFAAVRLNGGSVELAYALHGLVAGAAALAVVLVWRAKADWRLKGAQLMTGALITTPYVLDYDMVVLGPALALAVSHGLDKGFRAWEKTLLAAVFLTPIFTRNVAFVTGVHVGLVAELAFFAMTSARALEGWRPADLIGRRDEARGPALGGARREAAGFLVAGGIGFVVDAGVTMLLTGLGAGAVAARLPAIALALLTTFSINRRYAFAPSGRGLAAELARYVAVSATGAALNLVAYLAATALLARAGLPAAAAAVLGVAAGTGVGMVANFLGYRGFAFAPRRAG
jgi:putative flippase GtrA